MTLYDFFFPPKWKHRNAHVRWLAVMSITDDAILAGLALKDPAGSVRTSAVKAITSQEWLATVAREGEESIRVLATECLTDESILADLARSSTDRLVRSTAVRKISRKHLLAPLARNATDTHVKVVAIRQLADQNELFQLAANDSDAGIRAEARQTLIAAVAHSPESAAAFDMVYETAIAPPPNEQAFAGLAAIVNRHIGQLSAVQLTRLAQQPNVGERKKTWHPKPLTDAELRSLNDDPHSNWGQERPGTWVEEGTVLDFSPLRETARKELQRRG